MKTTLLWCRLAPIALALTCFAGFARAGNVRIAERPQLGSFATLQSAVDAALEGESLLVTSGAYASFTIDGKSLQVLVLGTGYATITGRVEVKNIGPAQQVLLSRLSVKGTHLTPGQIPALDIRGVTGNVRVQDCQFEGAPGSPSSGPEVTGTGARVEASLNIVFANCSIEGGYGGYVAGDSPIDGGPGLDSINSSIALYDCLIEGGTGSEEAAPRGGNGGPGYSGFYYGLFASGTTFRGGRGGGGDYTGCYPGGVGGDALVIDSGQAHLLGNTYTGGSGGWYLCGPNSPPGQTIVALNGSIIDMLLGSLRKISAPRIATDDASVPITITGQPGDSVFLMIARRPAFAFKKPLKGCWMVPTPFFNTALAAGTIGADGTLVLDRSFDIPDGSTGARMYWLQALCVDGAGAAMLTGPAQLLSIDKASAPTWYVDVLAGPGGNGSQLAPFQALAPAVNSAFHGDTIVMADGVYQGPSNRAINLNGRSLTLRSANGASNCTIDCQNAGRALSMLQKERVTIEGISFVNGQFSGVGGSIEAKGAQLTLLDSVFAANLAGDGGAVYISLGSLRMERCMFLGNLAPNAFGGGGAVSSDRTSVTGLDCVFASNSGANGGAVLVAQSTVATPPVIFTHCNFLENHATFGGAFHAKSGSAGTTHTFDNCQFAGNGAGTDGGALMAQASLAISNSTFVSNSAAGRGGALYLLHGTSSTIDNSIAYSNSAGQGPQIFLGDGNSPAAQLDVSYSDVEGGQAAVWLSQGVLNWGPHNLDLDPQFADADGPDNNATTFSDNDYALGANSPCIDSGDNAALIPDLLDVDGDGDRSELVPLDQRHSVRRVDVITVPDTGAGTAPIVDMGAFERQG